MQPDLPRIDADPQVAVKRAYKGLRRKRFHAPELPAEYLGTPDLGSLAVRSPFACYTRLHDDKTWEWDLLDLNTYRHHDGLRKIGSRVLFRINRGQLQAYEIDCELGKTIGPTDAKVGTRLQNRVVRRLDAPVARAPLQLGASGRRRTAGHCDS